MFINKNLQEISKEDVLNKIKNALRRIICHEYDIYSSQKASSRMHSKEDIEIWLSQFNNESVSLMTMMESLWLMERGSPKTMLDIFYQEYEDWLSEEKLEIVNENTSVNLRQKLLHALRKMFATQSMKRKREYEVREKNMNNAKIEAYKIFENFLNNDSNIEILLYLMESFEGIESPKSISEKAAKIAERVEKISSGKKSSPDELILEREIGHSTKKIKEDLQR